MEDAIDDHEMMESHVDAAPHEYFEGADYYDSEDDSAASGYADSDNDVVQDEDSDEEDDEDATDDDEHPSLYPTHPSGVSDSFLENLDPALAMDTSGVSLATGAQNQAQRASRSALSDAMDHWAQASAYWSNQKDLGFGFGQSQQKSMNENLEDLQAETRIAGAPMQSEFYQPMADEELDEFLQDPAFVGLDVPELTPPASSPPSIRGSRGRPRGGGARKRGRPRGGIAWALKGTEHDRSLQKKEERRAERAARGKKRGRPKGNVGPRRPADPGQEFKKHQSDATQAFMDGDMNQALDSARKAVGANPEVFTAHQLLCEILSRMGREQDAVAALMSGAFTKKDAGVWNQVAERTLQLAGGNPTTQQRKQALFAYSHALKQSPHDEYNQYIARAGKRNTSLDLGDLHEAQVQSAGMLRLRPTDMNNVRLYAELCAESPIDGDYWRAKEAYETAFNMLGQMDQDFDEPGDAWSHLNIYMEILDRIYRPKDTHTFFNQAENCQKAIVKLRRLARWILGRKDEAFWDEYSEDDREWDNSHERRAYVPEFQQGRTSRDRAHFGDGLPIELRIKMGIFRVRTGMRGHQEGLRHLDQLLALSSHADTYYDVFLQVCEALRAARLFEDALKFYQAVLEAVEVSEPTFFMGMAACYAETNRNGEAEDIYRDLNKKNPQAVESRIELAKLYEKQGWKKEALPVIKEVIKLGKKELIVRANLWPHEGIQPEPKAVKTPKPTTKRPPKQRRKSSQEQRPQQPLAPTPAPLHLPFTMQQIGVTEGYDQHALQHILPAPSAPGPSSKIKSKPLSASKRGGSKPKHYADRLQRMESQAKSIETHYEVIKQHWAAVEEDRDEDAVAQWIESACIMLEAFCQIDVFFPSKKEKRTRKQEFQGYAKTGKSWQGEASESQKEANALFERLRNARDDADDMEYLGTVQQAKPLNPSVPREFHGIAFTEWHMIFIDLCLLYAKRAEQEKCCFILNKVLLKANVFAFDPIFNNTTLAAGLFCAITFNDSKLIVDIGRKFIGHGDNRASMPYQLFAAANRACYGETDFNSSTTQKFMARMIKSMDHLQLPSEVRSKVDWGSAAPALSKRLEKFGEGHGNVDAGLLMAFGNMLALTQNIGSTGALNYYLRALALQPYSFSTNLGIGLCYVHNAMKRQSENRHWGIQQGLSFLQRYYELRTASGKAAHVQEAEYNMAKTWHMLGLTHLAVPRYEKVLALSESVQTECEPEVGCEAEDFAKEAAMALQQIFALAGNEEAAQAITEQWLVL